jgi:RND family efflux transporter MFP subunit
MIRSFRWLLAPTLALAVVQSFAGCKKEGTLTGPEPAATGSREPTQVRFAKVETKKLPPVLEITGSLDPDEKSEVAAQFAGAVKQVYVDVGTRVKKNDPLVLLDSSEASLKLASAKAMAEQQRARLGLKDGKFESETTPDVRSARETRDLAQKEAKRSAELAKEGAISQSVADEAKTAAERAQAQYESAKNGADQNFAGLKAAEAQARLSGKNLTDTRILAPFDGAVVEKKVAPGEFANVGRVVAVVVKDDPLRLHIDVPESEIAGIALGSPVTLRVAAFADRDFHGSVKRMGASVSPSSRTLPVEAEVENSEHVLRPGFFVRAQVALSGEPKDVLLVPAAAVGTTGSNARVFVRDGNRVIEKLVSTGRHEAGLIEIRGEIRAGDEIAIENVDRLSDTMEVAVH